MPRLYGTRYLTCFYCGRKNSTRYDAGTRRFECPFCDATNYLDENGDITDPPVATEKEATPRQYAVPQPFSPPSSPTDNAIFCATCLKNQHLLSASLAQYLPDPDDPDYAEREKGLYRFRKNQERLYPQICAECEPRVRQRLEQSIYTAKTDLLRRMLDRSASARGSVTTQGWLERFDAAGKWLWIAGFVLQLAWHAVVVHSLLSQYFIWAGVDDSLLTFRVLRICGPLVEGLPSAERLLGWSTLASIVGAWWNPRFAQICRGFTRHISGVSKWYFLQAMAVVARVSLQRMALTTPDPLLVYKQTASHAAAVVFAFLLFTLAPRSIKINMAPLFGTSPTQPLHEPPEPSPSAPTSRLDETKSIADLLDEISRSPTSANPPSPTLDASPCLPRRRTNFLPMGHAHTQAAQTLTANLQQNLQQIDHLNLHPSQSGAGAGTGGVEEMDWSPTPTTTSSFTSPTPETQTALNLIGKSKHRAFNTQGQRTSQPFGSAPTEPRKGPFWYRVPPAPTTPAQRVFNPPNQPRLRGSPVDGLEGGGRGGFGGGGAFGGGSMFGGGSGRQRGGQDGMRMRRGDDSSAPAVGRGGVDEREGEEGIGGPQQVAFAEPSFFAEMLGKTGKGGDKKGDPRNELSGLFGEGFKLDEEEELRMRQVGWWKRLVGGEGQDGKK